MQNIGAPPPNFTSYVLILERIWAYKSKCSETSLAVQWLRSHTSTAGDQNQDPHAMLCCLTHTELGILIFPHPYISSLHNHLSVFWQ